MKKLVILTIALSLVVSVVAVQGLTADEPSAESHDQPAGSVVAGDHTHHTAWWRNALGGCRPSITAMRDEIVIAPSRFFDPLPEHHTTDVEC